MKYLLSERDFYYQMLRLAIPVAVQNFVSSALNFVDTIMIGQFGKSELAAIGLANQFFFFLLLFLFGTYSSASIFTAQFWGKKDIVSIRRILGIALLTGCSSALIFTVGVLLFSGSLLRVYTDNAHVIGISQGYLHIVAFSYVATAITLAFSSQSRSVGQPKLPMIISGCCIILNTILNYILIFGHLGFPAMGVKGAATATLIARIIEMLVMLTVIYRTHHVLAAKIKELLSFSKSFIVQFYQTGYAVILTEIIWAMGVMACNAAYARMGESSYAALQMATPIQNICFVIFLGLQTACGVMLGNRIGACEEENAFICAKRFTVLGPFIACVIGGILIALSSRLVSAYNVSAAVKSDAAGILTVYAIFLLFRAFNLINIVGVLRSGGDTRFTLLLDAGSMWLIAVPFAYFGSTMWELPIYLVIAFVSLEELFKMVFGLKRLNSKKWVRNIVNQMDASF